MTRTPIANAMFDEWIYDIKLEGNNTVQQLIEEINKFYPGEDSVILIRDGLVHANDGNYHVSCTIKDKKIEEKPGKQHPAKLSDVKSKKIRIIRACGGWGHMTYYVNV